MNQPDLDNNGNNINCNGKNLCGNDIRSSDNAANLRESSRIAARAKEKEVEFNIS